MSDNLNEFRENLKKGHLVPVIDEPNYDYLKGFRDGVMQVDSFFEDSSDEKRKVEKNMSETQNNPYNPFLFNGDQVFIEAVIQQNAKLIVDIEALKMQKSQMTQTIKGLEAKIAENTKVANEELQESCEAIAIEYEKMQAELLAAKKDIVFLMQNGNPCDVCAKTCKMGEECHPVWEGKGE